MVSNIGRSDPPHDAGREWEWVTKMKSDGIFGLVIHTGFYMPSRHGTHILLAH